jgi:hypothetical protein
MTKFDAGKVAEIHKHLHSHLPSEPALRVKALETLLVEKGLVNPQTINAYNGAHVFPDLSARGTEVRQHCYNVMFEAAELWPYANGRNDKVYLDLWQDYLEEA